MQNHRSVIPWLTLIDLQCRGKAASDVRPYSRAAFYEQFGAGAECSRASRRDQNQSAALDAYQRLLQPFLARKPRAAQFTKSFAPTSQAGILVRHWTTRVIDLPLVARLSMGATLRGRIALPQYTAFQPRRFANAEMQKNAAPELTS
jgi:hypothetical protein